MDFNDTHKGNAQVRSTQVVQYHHNLWQNRLCAARSRQHGLQVMTIEQATTRIAGYFSRPI